MSVESKTEDSTVGWIKTEPMEDDQDMIQQPTSTYSIPWDIAACIPSNSEIGEVSRARLQGGTLVEIGMEDIHLNMEGSISDGVTRWSSCNLRAPGHDDMTRSSTGSSDTYIYDADQKDRTPSDDDQDKSSEVSLDQQSASELDERNTCDICNEEFQSQRELTKHRRSHVRLNDFQCDLCHKSFTDETKLARHKRTHIGEKPFRCDRCDMMFGHRSGLIQHKNVSHVGEEQIRSEESTSSYATGRYALPKRKVSVQRSYRDDDSDDDDDDGNGADADDGGDVNCAAAEDDSPTKVKDKPRPRIRKRAVKKPGQYKCDECDAVYSQKCSVARHKFTCHSGERPYSCDECDKTFAMKRNLRVHKRVHTGEKPFTCEICGKSFAWITSLAQHKMIHTGERPFQCDECGKTFQNNSAVVQHKRGVHSDERPFQCEECGKSFAQSGYLVIHKRVHTGERPFQCDLCEWSFKEKPKLTQHKRSIHFGETPFTCELCQQSFTRKSCLDKHSRRFHARDSTYHCECGKSFPDETKLTRHQITHITPPIVREANIRCDLCGKFFTRKSGLRKHKFRMHRNEASCADTNHSTVTSQTPEVNTAKDIGMATTSHQTQAQIQGGAPPAHAHFRPINLSN